MRKREKLEYLRLLEKNIMDVCVFVGSVCDGVDDVKKQHLRRRSMKEVFGLYFCFSTSFCFLILTRLLYIKHVL